MAIGAGLGLSDITVPAGLVIAATPNPVRNSELMAQLRKHFHRPPAIPTPAPLHWA